MWATKFYTHIKQPALLGDVSQSVHSGSADHLASHSVGTGVSFPR
jgi:hypothetical protein